MAFSEALQAALWLTFQLAALSSVLLLLLGYPLALWLARGPRWLTPMVRVLVNLPLVLPPTVLGYYLLVLMGREGWLTKHLGVQLAFSFGGLLIGSLVYSLPFAVGPYLSAIEGLNRQYEQAARALGLGRWHTLRYITFPLTRAGVITGTAMAFAHTIGEFGVVLLIGGNIPQQTQTASIYLFELIQVLDYQGAGQLAAFLLVLSVILLLLLQYYGERQKRGWG